MMQETPMNLENKKKINHKKIDPVTSSKTWHYFGQRVCMCSINGFALADM